MSSHSHNRTIRSHITVCPLLLHFMHLAIHEWRLLFLLSLPHNHSVQKLVFCTHDTLHKVRKKYSEPHWLLHYISFIVLCKISCHTRNMQNVQNSIEMISWNASNVMNDCARDRRGVPYVYASWVERWLANTTREGVSASAIGCLWRWAGFLRKRLTRILTRAVSVSDFDIGIRSRSNERLVETLERLICRSLLQNQQLTTESRRVVFIMVCL